MLTRTLTKPNLLLLAGVVAATGALAQSDEPLVNEESATHFAELAGGNVVPALEVEGTGTVFLVYDAQTNRIEWTVDYADLTGDLTGAHIHGPATAEENAGVVIDLRGGEETEGRLEGTAEITVEQANDLIEGLWYVNLHTEANPGGEIRGQLLPIEELAAAADEGAVAAGPPPGPTPQEIAALMDDGEELYRRNCSACHGNDGEGGEGPRLAGNGLLASVSTTVGQILFGGAYMPPFGGRFDDHEAAAVATFIRNAWGNEFGPVAATQVANMR